MIVRFAPGELRQSYTPVDNRFILDCLPHATGLAVQVYLYGLMLCAYPAASDCSLADALGLSQQAVQEAYVYWQQQGLVRILCQQPLTVEYLSAKETEGAEVPAGKHLNLVNALNALTAPRQFNARELRHVYDWVEVYSLAEDAALELVSYCMDVKGRRVSVNYMDAVAQGWAEAGIRTRADAIAYVSKYALSKHGATAILREWNKTRPPTKDEMTLYDKWTGEWGFTHEAILAALPRLTVSGSPNFVYLDEKLAQLREAGAATAPQVAEDDAKTASQKAFARLLLDRAGAGNNVTRTVLAQIELYLTEYQMPREVLLCAAEQCRGANDPFGLMKKLLNDWHTAGVDTVEKAEAAGKARASAPKGKPRRQPGYTQHDMTDQQLDQLLVDLDQEV